MVTYCLRRVIPACIPLTLFISEATVLIFELPDLAPSVLNRFSSLVASVTNCMSLPSICVVMERAFTPAIDKMSFDAIMSGSPSHAPREYTADDIKELYIKAYN